MSAGSPTNWLQRRKIAWLCVLVKGERWGAAREHPPKPQRSTLRWMETASGHHLRTTSSPLCLLWEPPKDWVSLLRDLKVENIPKQKASGKPCTHPSPQLPDPPRCADEREKQLCFSVQRRQDWLLSPQVSWALARHTAVQTVFSGGLQTSNYGHLRDRQT